MTAKKPNPPTTRILLVIPTDWADQLDQFAAETGEKRNYLILSLLRPKLRKYAEARGVKLTRPRRQGENLRRRKPANIGTEKKSGNIED